MHSEKLMQLHMDASIIRLYDLHQSSCVLYLSFSASFSSAGGSGDSRELLVQHLLVKEDDIKLLSDLQQRIARGL